MHNHECFLNRLEIQQGWSLAPLSHITLVLCGLGGMIKTLSLAAISSGIMNIKLVGEKKDRPFLRQVAENVVAHLGHETWSYIPVYSPRFIKTRNSLQPQKYVWIIDAGNPENDHVFPETDQLAYYYSECRTGYGADYISFGTDRWRVSCNRKGIPVHDRAEIPSVCSHLITGIIANLHICQDIMPFPSICRIPLPRIPYDFNDRHDNIPSILLAGGGGAIAHQVIWAEALDPIVKKVNQRRNFIIVDPKSIHESCRARQWGYPPESLNESKAQWTKDWIMSLFPGCNVQSFEEKLSEKNFHSLPVNGALASIDNWMGRRLLSELCDKSEIPWWSTGSSIFGGFCRQISKNNPWCNSAKDGVERLYDRPHDDLEAETSCSAPSTPSPSSVLPQMILGSFIACQERALMLGEVDLKYLARGIEVDLTHSNQEPGYEGLRWYPGRRLNLK
ncbi:MAG: ThiF family adenylyltransferase [bacterium]